MIARGGRRPGAGRKPAIDSLLRAAREAGYSAQRIAVIEMEMLVALHRAALRGNVSAGITLLRRAGHFRAISK